MSMIFKLLFCVLSVYQVTSVDFEPKVSPECAKQGYCDHVDNYPQEYIDKLLSKLSDAEKEKLFAPDDQEVLIESRIKRPKTADFCEHKTLQIGPHVSSNKDGNLHIVVQPKDRPPLFTYEYCLDRDGTCNDKAPDLYRHVKGYVYYCRQIYAYRQLASLNKNGTLARRSLKYPAFCNCRVDVDGFETDIPKELMDDKNKN